MSNAAVRDRSTRVSPRRQPLVSDEAWALIAPLLPVWRVNLDEKRRPDF